MNHLKHSVLIGIMMLMLRVLMLRCFVGRNLSGYVTRGSNIRLHAGMSSADGPAPRAVASWSRACRRSMFAVAISGDNPARSRCARNPLRARLHFREAATPEPEKQKPASKGGSAYPAEAGETRCLATTSFPDLADFRKPLCLPRAKCAQGQPLPGGLLLQPRRPLCCIRPRHPRPVPHRPPASALDAAEPRRRSPTAPASASPPSARSLRPQGQPRSTVSRHLAQLAAGGRHRAPAAPWWRLCLRHRGPLPAGCAGGVPPARTGCPTGGNRRTGR